MPIRANNNKNSRLNKATFVGYFADAIDIVAAVCDAPECARIISMFNVNLQNDFLHIP